MNTRNHCNNHYSRGVGNEYICFRFVLSHISSKKSLRVPVGVGGRCSANEVLITTYRRLSGFGDRIVLAPQIHNVDGDASDPLLMIRSFQGDMQEVRQANHRYRKTRVLWTFLHVDAAQYSCTEISICDLTSQLMAAGAHPNADSIYRLDDQT